MSAELKGENLNHAKVFHSKHSQGLLLEQIKGYLEQYSHSGLEEFQAQNSSSWG